MTTLRLLWAGIRGDPAGMVLLHKVLTVAWVVVGCAVVPMPELRESIPLLVFISIYANIVGHWSAAQAARVEVKQDEAAA